MAELLFKEEVYAVVGAAFEVYNELGVGFLEAVYQEALGAEFALRHIPYKPQQEIEVKYKGKPLGKRYAADFVVYDKIIIEIKAIEHLTTRETAQMINYLKATDYQLGILINFGSEKEMEWRRLVNTPRSEGKSKISQDQSPNSST